MRRWFVWLPLSLLAFIVAVLAAALLTRAELAEAAAKELLARRGLPQAELTVTTLTHRRLEVTDIRLGAGPQAPRAARIALTYDARALLDGRLERVELDGIDITVDMTAENPLGALGKLLEIPDRTARETDEPQQQQRRPAALPKRLPTLSLRNAAVTVVDPHSTVEMHFDGRVSERQGELQALLRGQVRAEHTTAQLVISAEHLRGEPQVQFEATGESDLARLPWPADSPVVPHAGRASFALDGQATLPRPGAALTPAALLERTAALSLSLQLADMDLTHKDTPLAGGADATVELQAESGDGALLLRLAEPLDATVQTLGTDALTALGLPANAAALAGRARHLAVAPWTGGGELLELRTTDNGWNWDGRASGRLELQDGGDVRLRANVHGAHAADFSFLAARATNLDLHAHNLHYGPHNLSNAQLLGNAEFNHGDLNADATLAVDGLRSGPHEVASAKLEGRAKGPLDHLNFEAKLTATDVRSPPHAASTARLDGKGSVKPGGVTFDGTLQADGLRLAAGGTALEGMRLTAPLALRHTGAGTRLTLSQLGQLVVPELPATPPVVVQAPLRLQLLTLEATALDGRLQVSGRVDPGQLSANVRRTGDPDMPVNLKPGPIEFGFDPGAPARVTAAISGAEIFASSVPARAGDVDLTLDTGDDSPLAEIRIGRLEHLGQPSFAAPARIQATLTRSAAGLLRADGRIETIGTPFQVQLLAFHSPESGSGAVSLNEQTVTFAPGSLQPGDLSPLLAQQIDRAEGSLTLTGRIGWSTEGLESSGAINVESLDVATPYASIEGLQGRMNFAKLIRPHSDGVQTLRASRAIAGVPLDEITLRFELDWPITGPEIGIELAEGHLAGGRIYVTDELFAPLAERNSLTVRVEELSLSKLVAELEIEGVEAEGIVAGQLPVTLTSEGVAIDRSRLDAVETGTIRVRMGQTSETLASRGEQVALMVRALRNFIYKELTLTLNRPAGGDPELGITMEGHNPEVLDGYPFRFNITLTGDLEPILAALQTGRRLTSDLLNRTLEAR